MYTMSGVTVSEGLSEGCAFVIMPNTITEEINSVRVFSASEEVIKYRKASRDFANKLNNAMSGTVPDKVRDLFGALASYITNAQNIKEIESLIYQGTTAYDAAEKILLSKIKKITGEVDEVDEENQSVSKEISSLMRDFIDTINTSQISNNSSPQLTEASVIVASDLSPAHFLSLHTELVRAVILEGGLSSGHLGTVLRDLRIPAIFGVKGALTIKNGEHILVDASKGTILVEPPLEAAKALIAQQYLYQDEDDDLDGNLKVTVACSMGAMSDPEHFSGSLIHGLGLLRSEFLFLNYRHEPSCEEMTQTFSTIFNKVPKSAPLTARTFDFAGDKKPLFTNELDETGSLRKYGAEVGSRLLKNELKALLLASKGRDITIVFPLITRISEAKALNVLLEQVKQELNDQNQEYGHPIVALMIETPAAVLSARAFASYGEMFLIGTSSLAEYAAAPRPPEEYFTPALSKMIAIACKGATDEGVKIGIAGRFTSRSELMPFFLSLGVSYITTDATSIHKIRKTLLSLSDLGFEPHFDRGLYQSVMDIASAKDLQELIFKEDNFL